MDPVTIFSIVVGVGQVISAAEGITKRLATFIDKVKSLPSYIQDVHDEIEALSGVLSQVRTTLDSRARQLPFERNHHAKTHRIIQSCHNSLAALGEEIPPLKDRSGWKLLRRGIADSFNEERIKKITQRIGSYKSILNISLTTLLLPALSETASSQQEIQMELQKLTHLIESSSIFSRRTAHDDNIETQFNLERNSSGASILEKEISDWRQTVDDVATAVAISCEAPSETRSVAPGSSVSVDTLTLCDDNFDPEPDLPDEHDGEILTYQIKENQRLVQEFIDGKLLVRASIYQRKGIELMKKLLSTQDGVMLEDASQERLADMEEKFADTLLECDDEKNKQEAKGVLKRLLQEEVDRGDQRDHDREARLYHTLGDLYFKEDNMKQALKFSRRALKVRREIEPMPCKLVEDSAELLATVLKQCQAFDEANGLHNWIQQVLHRDGDGTVLSSSTSAHTMRDSIEVTNPTSIYQWCKKNGNIDSENFRFGDCDPVSGTTPMHLAIKSENIDVLRIMLSNEGGVERRDLSGSTLLHAAAATRHYKICELILNEYSAVPTVFDRSGMSPLHRCQSHKGGLKVAEMLLEKCPELLNHVDYFGKTALHMACEKGNVNMVEFLLAEAQADPNIQGSGRRTPLITTIDDTADSSAKIAIVELLIKHRADPWIKDIDGRTAIMAARNIGLPSSEIKRILNWAPRRATSSATARRTTTSGIGRRCSEQSGHTI